MSPAHDHGLAGFCVAPWAEAVLYHDGLLRPCCISSKVLGNWQEEGLAAVWSGDRYRELRRRIADGRFPDRDCRICYENRTFRTLAGELLDPFNRYLGELERCLGELPGETGRLREVMDRRRIDPESRQRIAEFFSAVGEMRRDPRCRAGDVAVILDKIGTVATIAASYLEGDPAPPVVAAYRQVQLWTRCNARCVHCLGRFTGTIENGPSLDERFIEAAFSEPGTMLNFFMNGSELMLYPGWRRVAETLRNHGVRLNISTNGMPLTESNVRFLVDGDMVQTVNLSMDGACADTVEALHPKVSFSRVVAHAADLLEYSTARGVSFLCAFSLVVMKSNYREMADLVRLAARIRGDHRACRVIVVLSPLVHSDTEGYAGFLEAEHHSNVDRRDLAAAIEAARSAARELEVGLTVFGLEVEEYVRRGRPVPAIRPEAGNEAVVARHRDRRPADELAAGNLKIASVFLWQGSWNYNFWSNLDVDRLDSDFDRLEDLGFNTVVLSLPWGLFQTRVHPAAYDEERFAALDHVVRAADRRGFLVMLRVGSHEHVPAGIAGTHYHPFTLFLDDRELECYVDLFRETAARTRAHRNVLGLMYSWEDTFAYLDVCRRSSDRRLEVARVAPAWTDHLRTRPIDWWNRRWATGYSSYEEVPIPDLRSRAYRDLLLFHDRRQLRVVLPAVAEGVRSGSTDALLCHEARVDPDPYLLDDRQHFVRHDSTWRLPSGYRVIAAAFRPAWGAANDGSTIPAAAAARNLGTLLDRLVAVSRRPVFLDQLVTLDSTPGFDSASTLSEDDLDEFLDLALPVIGSKAAGYGFWSLEPYRGNLLINSSFQSGLDGWATSTEGAGEIDVRSDSDGSGRYIRLPPRASIAQEVKALWNPGALTPDVPYRLGIRVRGSSGSTLGLRWCVLDPGQSTWRLVAFHRFELEPDWRRHEVELPFGFHFDLQLGAEGPGGVDLDDLELANHVQMDAVLSGRGQVDGRRAERIRRFNRSFTSVR